MTHKLNQAANRKGGLGGSDVAPARRRGRQLAGADLPVPQNVRFTAMCVPGDRDDCSDSGWHVYDLQSRTSTKVGVGSLAQGQATDFAREANRAWRARQGRDNGAVEG
jgi:hypothetical protein